MVMKTLQALVEESEEEMDNMLYLPSRHTAQQRLLLTVVHKMEK